MADKLIDVEEAAARLGVSAGRVRAMCRSGQLRAHKVGFKWAINSRSVSSAAAASAKRRARRPPAKLDFGQALIQIRSELRLQFVPDLLRHADVSADVESVVKEARRRCAKLELPVDRIHLVEAPKDELAVRPGAVLNVLDWVIYHAAIARIAAAVDKRLSTAVYSSRVNKLTNKYLTKPYAKQHAAWQRKSRRLLKHGGYQYMMATDIVAYYEHIDIDKLYRMVQPLDDGNVSWPIIRTLLRDWSPNDIRGIPQGPEASAILGNLYLVPIDDMLVGRPRITHVRYMDDFRVFSNDRSELVRAANELQSIARDLGLDLKADKTHILTRSEALDKIEDAEKDLASYLMRTDKPKARRLLRKMVRAALRRAGAPDRRSVEFGLRRLRKLGDGNLLREVLDNLDRLAPSGNVIAEFIAHFPNRPEVINGVADFVTDNDRNLWPQYEMWLLFAAGEATVPVPSHLAHHVRQRLGDGGQPWWLRAAALDVVAKEAGEPINDRAIADVIRTARDLYFYRQTAAILLQRGIATKSLAREASRLPDAQRLVSYLESGPTPPARWLGT